MRFLKGYLQNSHSDREPEVLVADKIGTTQIPRTSGRVIRIPKNNKCPYEI